MAVQVSGDPDPANNGLFHIYADHLGSTGSLSDSSGGYIPNSHAKYTPFGDWRTEPTATAGHRYYTNHKHNNLGNGANDLGLIYMNARYYLPGVGRFASADTVVPNAANPQSYNRYSYAYNNPIKLFDPSGHIAIDNDKLSSGGGTPPCYDSTGMMSGCVNVVGGAQQIESGAQDPAVTETLKVTLSFVPIVGEAIDAIDITNAFVNGEFDEAAFLLILAAAPGSAEALREGGSGVIRAINGIDDSSARTVMNFIETLCSFSEDTLVMTGAGLIPIAEVNVGELVLAFNEATGEIGYYPVTATWAHLDPIIVELTIDGEVVWTTPEHPFYTADGDWEAVFELQVGEEIQQADGTTGIVEGVVYHARPQMMYNMTVATAHTYFVGDGHWLVHNACEAFANTANLALRQLSPELRGVTIAMSLDDAGQPILAVYGRTGQITEDAVASLRRKGWNVLDAPPRGSAYHAERQLYDEGYTQIGISRQRGMCSSCEDFFNDKPHVTVTEYSPP